MRLEFWNEIVRGVTYLVGSFIQVLGIQRHAETKGGSWAEENVVGQCGDATVIYLSLLSEAMLARISQLYVSRISCLDE